ILHENIYDEFIARFKLAMNDIKVGPAKDPATYLSALIDEDSLKKTLRAIEDLKQTYKATRIGVKVHQAGLSKDLYPNIDFQGYYFPPTLIEGLPPEAEVSCKELFAPVVAAFKVKDIQEAVELSNSLNVALTGGIYSRNPNVIKYVKENLEVGNLYINRSITGAIVGRHPFGGYKLSGIGSKAGGPDYLLQFADPVTIVENTLRRGYSPDLE
ncbi:MAG: aldehyde dehydrogenase family protein, partial [Candidatus Caenarcaniphilales bacterium]|nr:aldehyde dehydrogenase family protein [Candidatus Caenarcaniphilales bacterium]